jgi:isocitrate dehydrogenase
VPTLPATIVDGTLMSAAALRAFLADAIRQAKADGVLLSVHLKATMMKVSDPVIFGHAVRVFFADLFDEYGDVLADAGFNPNNGLATLDAALAEVPADTRTPSRPTSPPCTPPPRTGDGQLRQGHHQPARAPT